MEEFPKRNITVRILQIKGQSAILQTEDNQKINWPKEKLPNGLKEDDQARLLISDSATDREEREKTAKEILNQILKE